MMLFHPFCYIFETGLLQIVETRLFKMNHRLFRGFATFLW